MRTISVFNGPFLSAFISLSQIKLHFLIGHKQLKIKQLLSIPCVNRENFHVGRNFYLFVCMFSCTTEGGAYDDSVDQGHYIHSVL